MNARPKALKLGQEVSRSAVAQTNPYQATGLWLSVHQVEEVLIFRDDGTSLFTRIPPHFSIRCRTKPNLYDVKAVAAYGRKKAGKRSGELVINQEFHEVASTI